MGKILLNIRGESYVLTYTDFNEDIDVEKIVRTDIVDFISELIIFPSILNRVGIMLADCEEMCKTLKFDLQILEAKISENLKSISDKKPTVKDCDDAILLDPNYQKLKKSLISAERDRDIINSLYWAAKDKSDKLNKMSLSLKPEDLQEAKEVYIKTHNKAKKPLIS